MADLETFRGDSPPWEFTIEVAGTPVDLTGLQAATLTAKDDLASADPGLLQKTLAGGGIAVTDASAGKLEVRFVPNDTTSLLTDPTRSRVLEYDLEIIEASGRVSTVARGRLVIKPDVTTDPPP